jgi:hypothetical protein
MTQPKTIKGKAIEVGIKYCQSQNLVVPFFSKKVNKVFYEALQKAVDIYADEVKKVVEDELVLLDKTRESLLRRLSSK